MKLSDLDDHNVLPIKENETPLWNLIPIRPTRISWLKHLGVYDLKNMFCVIYWLEAGAQCVILNLLEILEESAIDRL